MNVEHLKLFVRVAVTHNISQAGAELGLSPAVSSAHVSKLEEALGVRLIHRTTRKVSLTEEGMAFLPHAEEVLASVEAARGLSGSRGSLAPRNFKSNGVSFVRAYAFGAALGDFLSRYPELNLDLRLTDYIVDLVEGGFDIAIRNSDLKDSTLIARKLAPDRRILCASPEYLAKHGEPQLPSDLLEHQCVSLMGLDNWIFDTSEGQLTLKVEGRLRTDHGEAMRDASVGGLGISINSTWSVYEHMKRGELVQVLPNFPLVS